MSQYLEEAIDSILCQEVSDWELIVVNDASTDNSLEILQAYQKKDKRIKVIDLEENRLPGYARNLAMSRAKGDYFVFLDADDYFQEDAFTILCKYIASKPKTEVFVLGFLSFRAGKKLKKEKLPQKPNKEQGETYFLLAMSSRKGFDPPPWVYVVKRTFVEQHHIYFSEGINFEDIEFTTKVVYHAKKVTIIPKVCYYYRRHKLSVTGNFSSRKIKSKFAAFDTIKPFLIERGTWSYYESIHNVRYLAFCVFTCFNEYFLLSKKQRSPEIDAFMLSLRKSELLNTKNLNLLRNFELSLPKKEEARKFYLTAFIGLSRIKKQYGVHRFIVRNLTKIYRLRA